MRELRDRFEEMRLDEKKCAQDLALELRGADLCEVVDSLPPGFFLIVAGKLLENIWEGVPKGSLPVLNMKTHRFEWFWYGPEHADWDPWIQKPLEICQGVEKIGDGGNGDEVGGS